jgi:hypothetical protein
MPEKELSEEERFEKQFPRDHDCFVAGVVGIKFFLLQSNQRAREAGDNEGELRSLKWSRMVMGYKSEKEIFRLMDERIKELEKVLNVSSSSFPQTAS